MNGLLRAERLTVGHREPALRDVEFTVAPGENWFVLGRNGAGKTTLLRTLIGRLRPLAGRVGFAPALGDRRRLGYVPQEQRFARTLPCTVAEFVVLGQPDRERRGAVAAAVDGALAVLGIGDLAGRDMGRLSVGQRRRAVLARALARDPALLLLDEPFANLDQPTAVRLSADLDGLRLERNLALFQVSHELQLAERHATHVALVADGRVVAGPAALLFADDRLRRAFDPLAAR